VAPAQPRRSGELGDQVLTVAFGEFDATDVVHPCRLVDVLVDLCQASTIRLACRVVEDWQTASSVGGCMVGAGRRVTSSPWAMCSPT
jgi:hypothetical protein